MNPITHIIVKATFGPTLRTSFISTPRPIATIDTTNKYFDNFEMIDLNIF